MGGDRQTQKRGHTSDGRKEGITCSFIYTDLIQENKKKKKLIQNWKFIGRPPLRLLSIIYELNDNFLLRLVNTEYLPKK